MPSLQDAYWRHANLYLSVIEGANDLFLQKTDQENGLRIFDQNREQVEIAIEWILQQDPLEQIDVLLSRFVDAISSIGMVRYSVRKKLIPLHEYKIAAAQRLCWKELEADSFDGLGILYAYLGYLPQAISYFQHAYEIAREAGAKDLTREIKKHLSLAKKQSNERKIPLFVRVSSVFGLVPAWINLFLARVKHNHFSEISSLNKIANLHLVLKKWDSSIGFFQRAITLSQELSYRFGQLEASMGLLQAEMSKDEFLFDGAASMHDIRNLSDDFMWGIDVQVLEILLEIAPAVRDTEYIATYLNEKSDPLAAEIYKHLDQIMLRTEEIVLASMEERKDKNKIFATSLRSIRENFAEISQISSSINEGSI
jgi:tetratricopeptide (TPR) repeat protein